MLLQKKVAAIYGAGGPIGGAVARAFAREGANVYLAGRTEDKLESLARDIRSNGGVVNTAPVDALDQQAVERFVDTMVDQTGRIDISFNLSYLSTTCNVRCSIFQLTTSFDRLPPQCARTFLPRRPQPAT